MDVCAEMDQGQCLLFLLKSPLLQEEKEVDIWVDISESLIPFVTAALLWMEVEVYNI